jgi:Zn finger protein HypA/HybF involved in hydrogenase expression
MSIAMEVCRMAGERLTAAGATSTSLVELGMEVGDDAGVELDNLQFCLEALLAAPPFSGARAAMARVPGNVLRLTYLEVDDGGPND